MKDFLFMISAWVIGIMTGALIFFSSHNTGKSLQLSTGNYNIVHIMDKSEDISEPRQELLVSTMNNPTKHLFVTVSEKCFASYFAGAELLIINNDDSCIWTTTRRPPSPEFDIP
ncbi:MAG: hypothetical protein COU29_00930 [Candidatus Magasanikbacteria bacterium CG10_big_fil_rev_8_21_14_0_10_36_32]|uniref:Uncharacterized protein n=1 Tax=Candidatus Magasanikbacteria bacterium CG10_big_fil_rev_8_21_14_0_10_36_32 TaxID=1974646 RepID=A0A2M6W6C3_9BACT|nr:MAG: hypothetical protein COU29_00930 [Candidatus Magasanikbacteria bacterium CG10_big_fil_rev_8_21_14_0_10_36_32]